MRLKITSGPLLDESIMIVSPIEAASVAGGAKC